MARIIVAPSSQSFECDERDTILRAGLRAGLAFPYECNVGSCGNCRFELISGQVEHERRNAPAWSGRDQAKRRYLGCQARPQEDCTIKLRLEPDASIASLPRPRKILGTLTTVTEITHDIREFRFWLSHPAPFLAGQYALLQIPDVVGMRAYSMSNTGETGEEWHFQIKRVPGGAATQHLFHHLSRGATINLDGPYGKGYLREGSPRDILCIAGGSGLSPMISIARRAAVSPGLATRRIHFVYGGRSVRDICGEPMLRELPGFGSRLLYYPAVSAHNESDPQTWDGHVGFAHDIVQRIFNDNLAEFEIYLAGPPPMVSELLRMLIAAKVPPTQIHYDRFC